MSKRSRSLIRRLAPCLLGVGFGCHSNESPPRLPVTSLDPRPAEAPRELSMRALAPGRRVVASVDGVAITAGDVYPLLFLSFHDETVEAIRQTVIQHLVELESVRVGVRLQNAAVVAEMERLLGEYEREVLSRSGGRESFASYLSNVFGLTPEEYRGWLRDSVTKSLLLERVVLWELMQHPRVQVRIIRVRKRKLAAEILDKIKRGADFAILAETHSEDASAADGGLYPPLPTNLEDGLLASLESVPAGGFDEIREVETADGTAYRILQVMTRFAPDQRPYSQLAPRINEELNTRPISQLELEAWMRIMESRYDVRWWGIGKTNG